MPRERSSWNNSRALLLDEKGGRYAVGRHCGRFGHAVDEICRHFGQIVASTLFVKEQRSELFPTGTLLGIKMERLRADEKRLPYPRNRNACRESAARGKPPEVREISFSPAKFSRRNSKLN